LNFVFLIKNAYSGRARQHTMMDWLINIQGIRETISQAVKGMPEVVFAALSH